jgi:hypothetical protein
VRAEHRHAAYAYDLAVEPPAAKELRLFGLAGWVIDRFTTRRTGYTSCSGKPPGSGSGHWSGRC